MMTLGSIGQALYMRLFFHLANLYDGANRQRLVFQKRYDDVCAEKFSCRSAGDDSRGGRPVRRVGGRLPPADRRGQDSASAAIRLAVYRVYR